MKLALIWSCFGSVAFLLVKLIIPSSSHILSSWLRNICPSGLPPSWRHSCAPWNFCLTSPVGVLLDSVKWCRFIRGALFQRSIFLKILCVCAHSCVHACMWVHTYHCAGIGVRGQPNVGPALHLVGAGSLVYFCPQIFQGLSHLRLPSHNGNTGIIDLCYYIQVYMGI